MNPTIVKAATIPSKQVYELNLEPREDDQKQQNVSQRKLTGMRSIKDIPTIMFFDTRASYSFISKAYVENLEFNSQEISQ